MKRCALLSFLLAGCLDAPTGKPATWPPTGVTVAALAAGDLDGTGGDELAIVTTGDAPTLYILPTSATDFTRAASLDDVVAPATAMIADHQLVILHDTSTGPHVSVYDGTTLARTGDVALGFASASPMWIAPVEFPGNSARFVFAVGGTLVHFSLDEITGGIGMVPQLPPPGSSWTEPQAVATIGSAANIVVAERADVQESAIPTQPPPTGTWSWSPVRTGNDWVGQAASDLTGDGNAEIVGLDVSTTPAKLCAANPQAGTTTNCVSGNIGGVGTVVGSLVQLDQGGPDYVVLETGEPNGSHLTVLPNVADANGTLSADPMLGTTDLDPTTAFAVVDGHDIYTMTAAGELACWTPSGGALGACP